MRPFIFSFALACSATFATAQELDDERKMAGLLTLSEVALSSAALLRERYPEEMVEFEWSAEFRPHSWSMTFSGKGPTDAAVDLSLYGMLWPTEADDWVFGFSGGGQYRNEPVIVTGGSRFSTYENETGVFRRATMEYDQILRIGDESWRGWIKGAELIVGGAIGGAGGVIAAPATAGASIILGIGGAMGGAASAMSISNEAREFFDSDSTDGEEPVASPPQPELPSLPEPGDALPADDNQTIIVASREEGTIGGSFPGDGLSMAGTLSFEEGSVSATIGMSQ